MIIIDDKLFTQIAKAKQLAAEFQVLSEFNDELDSLLHKLHFDKTEEVHNKTRKQFAYWLNSAIKVLRKERAYIERNNLPGIKFDLDTICKINTCTSQPLEVLGLADSFQNQLDLKSKRDSIKKYLHTMEEIASYIKKLQILEQTAYTYLLNSNIDGFIDDISQMRDNSKTVELKKEASRLLSEYKRELLECFETWIQRNALKINQIINQQINRWNYRFSNFYTQPNLRRENKILVERTLNVDMTVYNDHLSITYETWENWADKKLYNLSELEKDFADGFLEIINDLLANYLKLNLSGIYVKLPEVKAMVDGQMTEINEQLESLKALENYYQQLFEHMYEHGKF